MNQDFICGKCKQPIPYSKFIGTKHRNHCPNCLWSKHVDLEIPGDRKANCGALMEPIGLTFKKQKGEIMLIHKCLKCGKISLNRIAGDDSPEAILKIKDNKQIREQIFGIISLSTPD
jgi:DNA-directed RNA polymerase subunit RPC12/RpoP